MNLPLVAAICLLGSPHVRAADDTCSATLAKFNAEMTALEERLKDASAAEAAKSFRKAAITWRETLRPGLLRSDTMGADCWRIAALMALDLQDANLATHAREAFARLNVTDVPADAMASLDAIVDRDLLARIPEAREKFVRTIGWVEGAGENAKGVDLFEIGDAYAQGVALPKDDVAANEYFQRAAEKGSTRAMWRLGMRTRSGVGCDADKAAGLAMVVRAADAGDAEAQVIASRVLVSGPAEEQDKARGEGLLAKGAAAGDAECAFVLATFLREGEALPKDAKRALKLFEQAARVNMNAAMSAAAMHRAGEAGTPNPKAAAGLYQSVIDGPEKDLHASASVHLGDMMIRREGFTEADAEAGVELLVAAIEQPEGAPGILILADHYATGKFIPENPERAFELWKKSHEDNVDFEGTYLLSRAYKNGFGVEADEAEALRLLKKAAEMGSTKAAADLEAMDDE